MLFFNVVGGSKVEQEKIGKFIAERRKK